MSTQIFITPNGSVEEELLIYESLSIQDSLTDRASTCNITMPYHKTTDITRFTVGSQIRVITNGTEFKFWLVKPPLKLNGLIKTLQMECLSYEAKTQKIVVNESYVDKQVDFIVDDLFTKYVPWATRTGIQTATKVVSIRFPDMFLWDCMEQLCTLVGYDWYLDIDMDLQFFQTANNVSTYTITENNFKKGTASFTPDASKLVNRLWIKGAKGTSLPFTQNIEVDMYYSPIPLFYTPYINDLSTITITIGGNPKTVGIEGVAEEGYYDFLINKAEKLLVPDLCPTGTGTIEYNYEYPVKILLEDEESMATYGTFEDILTVDTDDKYLAREVGSRYLEKHSDPILVGSVEPFSGTYKAGELIQVNIPSLDINTFLVIKDVSYEASPLKPINIKLNLESTPRDLEQILKDMNKRLSKMEKELYGTTDDTIVESYKLFKEKIYVPRAQDNGIIYSLPTPQDDGIEWVLHDYWIVGSDFIPCPDMMI